MKVNVCSGACHDAIIDMSSGCVYNMACLAASCMVTKKEQQSLMCEDLKKKQRKTDTSD